VLTVAAYNAGPGMVDDWINGTNKTGKNESLTKIGDPRKGEISDAGFTSAIPLKETREHVQKVLGCCQHPAGRDNWFHIPDAVLE
jgi:soluble lytic murein transglycosylase-like protein